MKKSLLFMALLGIIFGLVVFCLAIPANVIEYNRCPAETIDVESTILCCIAAGLAVLGGFACVPFSMELPSLKKAKIYYVFIGVSFVIMAMSLVGLIAVAEDMAQSIENYDCSQPGLWIALLIFISLLSLTW
eukprot:CAMPEP_0174232458 /NCGR_PEP_ID=MMETSP0417-20130205/2740_1 /TAXON_ID=242541 /ORGANISM="Mayorella sp, Strain BSH-02190019" /LENGTH=131 /DNA_ID=CAMNT_0015310511 /DNA_START=182 /DNA_END=574 /DNA_ORIENTATION=-